METTQKEELRKVFDVWWRESTFDNQNTPSVDSMFTWFWKEIEAVRNTYNALDKAHQTASDQIQELRKQLKSQQEIIEAADALIDVQAKSLRTYGRHILIENQHDSYNQLKSNQQSPNS